MAGSKGAAEGAIYTEDRTRGAGLLDLGGGVGVELNTAAVLLFAGTLALGFVDKGGLGGGFCLFSSAGRAGIGGAGDDATGGGEGGV
jgi:hypothetical protein